MVAVVYINVVNLCVHYPCKLEAALC